MGMMDLRRQIISDNLQIKSASEHPIHVALLETIDGVQIKRECYRHEVVTTEPAEEGKGKNE